MRGKLAVGAAALLPAITGCATPNSAFDGSYVRDYDSCVAEGHALDPYDSSRCYFDGQVFVQRR